MVKYFMFFKNNKKKIHQKHFIDCNLDYRKSILIAGVGRSGTTWLTELINYNYDFRFIFEPLNIWELCNRKIAFDTWYLNPDVNDIETKIFLRAILSGNFRNSWSDQYNEKMICRRRIIKTIRANLLLKWIYINFPGMPIILIVRNPYAVAYSRKKMRLFSSGWVWKPDLATLVLQNQLVEDHLYPFKTAIENVDDSFEEDIFSWCISHYVPFQQFRPGEIYIVFYENLCMRPEVELKKIFRFLNIIWDSRVLRNIHRPSKVTRNTRSLSKGHDSVNAWRAHINDEQIIQGNEILKMFNLDHIYGRESIPQIDNGSIFLKNIY